MKPDLPTGHLVPAQRIGLAPYCGASLPGPPTALPPESASSVGGAAADPASRRSNNLRTATVLGVYYVPRVSNRLPLRQLETSGCAAGVHDLLFCYMGVPGC